MMKKRFIVWLLSVGMVVLCCGVVFGQNYPRKMVRFVTTEPGSQNDLIVRTMAPWLSKGLGQQVIVENRGIMAIDAVVKAPPDGYTLLAYGNGTWLMPLLRSTNYDPVKDLSPITIAGSSANILILNLSVPAKSVKELIALAKARPGELNYASNTTGMPGHLGMELFNDMAGVKIVRVPYKGTGPGLIAMLSGEAQVMYPAAGAAMPLVKSGQLRALAVGTAKPSALVPGLPTIADSGLPGFETDSAAGMFAPPKTPAKIIEKLNHEMVRALNREEVKARLLKSGIEVVGCSPEQLAATIKSDMAKYGMLIKRLGIRDE
jgi:tripartite-type tricarboxylate transporter receptor subunit TctC